MASHIVTQDRCSNPMKELYEHLIKEKQKSPEMARQAVAGRLAVLAYGVLKTGEKYDSKRREKKRKEKKRSDQIFKVLKQKV